MADVTTEKRGPGRPPRQQETAQRRRRRGDSGLAAEKQLPIPPEIEARLKREGRTPRWVNDERNRMHRFTVQDDYDPVEGVEPVPVGTDKTGKPILAHLLSKPTALIREDQASAETRRREIEEALFRKPDAADVSARGRNPNPATAERYIDEASGIRRGGNQILEG